MSISEVILDVNKLGLSPEATEHYHALEKSKDLLINYANLHDIKSLNNLNCVITMPRQFYVYNSYSQVIIDSELLDKLMEKYPEEFIWNV